MLKSISVLSLLICLNLFANDSFPADEKKQQTFLNSNHNHNHSSTTLIQVKEPEKEKTFWQNVYEFFKDFSGSIIAGGGIIAGYLLVRRKLIEAHISKAIIDMQEANKRVLAEVTELMDQYVPKIKTNEFIDQNEMVEIEKSIQNLFKNSQGANSGAQTTLFYLKFTIQQTFKNWEKMEESNFLSTRDVYGLILLILDRVTFLLSQVVPVPDSIRTEAQPWFDEKLEPYLTNSEFIKYKSFQQGLDYDPHSALYLMFYIDVLSKSYTLFWRSAFQIYSDTSAISLLLKITKIYAPLTITKPSNDPDDEDAKFVLYLVGFKESETWYQQGGKETFVKLVYANPNDYSLFATRSNLKEAIYKFEDSYLTNSGFDIANMNKLTSKTFETVELLFTKEYLAGLYDKNKEIIESKLFKKPKSIKRNWRKLVLKFRFNNVRKN